MARAVLRRRLNLLPSRLHRRPVSHYCLLSTDVNINTSSLNHLYFNFFMVFLKDSSLVLYSSSYTPLLSVLSYLILQQTTNSIYADDTQLLLSFSALDFSHNITHFENTITNVANWMSSNFLSLNRSKTEFLIFSLPQQLSKLNNPTIHLPNNVKIIIIIIIASRDDDGG